MNEDGELIQRQDARHGCDSHASCTRDRWGHVVSQTWCQELAIENPKSREGKPLSLSLRARPRLTPSVGTVIGEIIGNQLTHSNLPIFFQRNLYQIFSCFQALKQREAILKLILKNENVSGKLKFSLIL